VTTSVTFENAAFAEIIKRADRITPKKGEAFDKASGIVLDIDPSQEWGVTVRATNLEVYYTEWATALGIEGDKVTWRLSAPMLVAMITKLPIGTGKTVTLTNVEGMLQITSGRFRAKIALLDPQYYPRWNAFDPSGTAPVADLGARIEQVAWACAKNSPGEAISGIRFNGETLATTDRYRLASVPCPAPHLRDELVVPASVIAPLIKQMGDTNVGIVGNHLVFMPNEYTQIMCVIYEGKFPKIERVMAKDHPESIKVDKGRFIDFIGRVVTANQRERMPELAVFIGQEEVAFYMEDGDGRDSAGDVMEIPGQATHERFKFLITPSSLVDALTAAPNGVIDLHYDPANRMKVLRIDGGSGYESWVVPRQGVGQ
jgi:DNA polymerase III sliding clamp (beta) subunit (PCNA family)